MSHVDEKEKKNAKNGKCVCGCVCVCGGGVIKENNKNIRAYGPGEAITKIFKEIIQR